MKLNLIPTNFIPSIFQLLLFHEFDKLLLAFDI